MYLCIYCVSEVQIFLCMCMSQVFLFFFSSFFFSVAEGVTAVLRLWAHHVNKYKFIQVVCTHCRNRFSVFFFNLIVNFEKVAFISVYVYLNAYVCHMYPLIDTKSCIKVLLSGRYFIPQSVLIFILFSTLFWTLKK